MELKEAIYQRRSVRDYTDQPVDKLSVMTLLGAAVQAPSALNLQPWAFAVVQDRVLLKRFSDRAKVLVSGSGGLGAAHPELKEMLADPAFNIFYNVMPIIVGHPRAPAPATDRKEPEVLCWR